MIFRCLFLMLDSLSLSFNNKLLRAICLPQSRSRLVAYQMARGWTTLGPEKNQKKGGRSHLPWRKYSPAATMWSVMIPFVSLQLSRLVLWQLWCTAGLTASLCEEEVSLPCTSNSGCKCLISHNGRNQVLLRHYFC